jgi:hypothetical protein
MVSQIHLSSANSRADRKGVAFEDCFGGRNVAVEQFAFLQLGQGLPFRLFGVLENIKLFNYSKSYEFLSCM